MRLKRILIFIGIVLLLVGGVFAWNVYTNQNFELTFYQMSTEKNISKLRVIELSDLHLHEYGEHNDKLVERISGLKPDIIAMAGDMTNEDDPDHSIVISLIERLVKVAPVYYSPGNHEYTDILYNKSSTLIKDIEKAGAIYVDGKIVEVEAGGNQFLIGGVCKNADDVLKYKSSTEMLEKFTKEEPFKILLSHYPEIFISKMEAYPVDLALSGHAHGGQIRLPGTDGLYAPDQGFLPKYTSGMRTMSGSTVVISRGLGGSNWLRINNRPELVIIDIN